MEIVTAIAIFFVVWWISLFAVLPIGIRQAQDKGEGHMPGAPEKPNFKRIILINTLVAMVITGTLWTAIYYGGLSVRNFGG